MEDIITKYRNGELDINNKESFFSILIKGLLINLNNSIHLQDKNVPHFILHTGDEQMYLDVKGQDSSIEPMSISNEDYVYNSTPRCIVAPAGVDILPDQVTNPYTRGIFQIDNGDNLYTLSAEFRRMPVKLSVELKYYLDTYTDLLNITQQLITNLSFIRNYNINYLGQVIQCSYKIPESFSGEHLMEIDETLSDSRFKTLSLSIEVESNLPVFANGTVISTNNIISDYQYNIKVL